MPISPTRLTGERTTHLRNTPTEQHPAGETLPPIHDSWLYAARPNQQLQFKWTGETHFKITTTATSSTSARPNTTTAPTPSDQSTTGPTGDPPRTEMETLQEDHTTGSQEQTATGDTETSPDDYWRQEEDRWVRRRINPRRAIYIPKQTADGPDINDFTVERTTHVRKIPTEQHLAGESIPPIQDSWLYAARPNQQLQF